MIVILSPATTMDFSKKFDPTMVNNPHFDKESNYLIDILKKSDFQFIKNLMNLSDDLTKINMERYLNFNKTINPKSPSMYAFNGEVFSNIDIMNMNLDDIKFANNHFLILSGLYGCLKPLDLIQPYRLEMKSKLNTDDGNNLYKFWKNRITEYMIKEVATHENKSILNLASNEYSKAIDIKELNKNCSFINVEFKTYDQKKNAYKVVGMHAKKSRGIMSNFIIKNKIDSLEEIKKLEINNHIFNENLSDDFNLIFTNTKL